MELYSLELTKTFLIKQAHKVFRLVLTHTYSVH